MVVEVCAFMRWLVFSEPSQQKPSRSPTVTSSVPSRRKNMRPGLAPDFSHASATKISWKFPIESAVNVPRPTAIVLPRGPYFGYDRYTRWFCANEGWSSMKCSASAPLAGPGEPAGAGGASQAGFGSSAPSLMTRSRPDRSATSMVWASGNAML